MSIRGCQSRHWGSLFHIRYAFRRSGFRLLFLSCLGCLLPSTGSLAEPVLITEADNISLLNQRQVYRGDQALASIEEVMQQADDAWASNIPLSRSPTTTGPTYRERGNGPSQKFWTRVQLKSQGLQRADWYIHFPSAIDYVEFYSTIDGQVVNSYTTGNQFGFYARPVINPDLLLPLSLPANAEVTLYFAYQQFGDARSPVELVEREHFYQTEQKTHFQLIFLFGALTIMVVYNLFIFFSVRDISYLYYSLTMGLTMIGLMAIQGFDFEWLWPNYPWIHKNVLGTAMPLATTFSTLFCISFLQVKKLSKILYRYLWIIVGCHIFSLLWVKLVPYPALFAFPLIIISYASYLVIGIYAWRRGIKYAPYFSVAWLGTSAIMIAIGTALFLNKEVDLSLNLLRAMVLEALLLSFALGARIKILQRMEIEEKNEFFSRISHEMRTPLNGILGSLSLIQNEKLSQNDSEVIDYARQSANQFNELVMDILNFTDLRNRKPKAESTKNKFRDFIGDIYGYYAEVFRRKGLLFCIGVSPIIPNNLYFDSYRLRTVLCTLLDNANKFTRQGYTVVDITQRKITDNKVTLRFSIHDTGMGVEPSQLQRIFDTFKQAENFYSRSHGGLGLGLSIAAQNLETLGSKIKVLSTPGKGSRFYFDIEMAYDAENNTDHNSVEQKPAEQSLAENTLSGMSILYVEDNQINQMITKKILENCGHTVDLAENGREGVDKVLNKHYDAVLMDCAMPVMNGFEATEAIRAAGYHDLPIIAVTANAMPGDKDRCLSAGMDDYVSKPVNKPMLLGAIYRATELHARQAS